MHLFLLYSENAFEVYFRYFKIYFQPDDIAKHKKTDEDTPADEAAKEASTEETKSEAAGGDASPATKNQKKKGKSSKADLETEQVL